MIRIELPWPDKNLNPNKARSLHWTKISKAKKSAKELAYVMALKTRKDRHFEDGDNIPMSVIFYFPDNRRRDRDNMVASIKAYLDGIALGWGVDDYRFHPEYHYVKSPDFSGVVIEILG